MGEPVSLRDYADGRFKELDGRLTALETRVSTAMADQAHATERSIDGLTAVLNEINKRILEVEKTLAGFKGTLAIVGACWSVVLVVIAALVAKWIGG